MLCMGMGWTWDYVDQHMTLPRLYEILAYWKRQPPLFLMVGWYLGIGSGANGGVRKFEDLSESEKADFLGRLAAIGG